MRLCTNPSLWPQIPKLHLSKMNSMKALYSSHYRMDWPCSITSPEKVYPPLQSKPLISVSRPRRATSRSSQSEIGSKVSRDSQSNGYSNLMIPLSSSMERIPSMSLGKGLRNTSWTYTVSNLLRTRRLSTLRTVRPTNSSSLKLYLAVIFDYLESCDTTTWPSAAHWDDIDG